MILSVSSTTKLCFLVFEKFLGTSVRASVTASLQTNSGVIKVLKGEQDTKAKQDFLLQLSTQSNSGWLMLLHMISLGAEHGCDTNWLNLYLKAALHRHFKCLLEKKTGLHWKLFSLLDIYGWLEVGGPSLADPQSHLH